MGKNNKPESKVEKETEKKIEVKSIEYFLEHKNKFLKENPIEFKETDNDSFLFLLELDKKELNYNVFYQSNQFGDSVPIEFPSNFTLRDFENFSDNYMYMQLVHSADIFSQLRKFYELYPMAFKYRFTVIVLEKMATLLNNNRNSKHYDNYLQFYNAFNQFIDEFNPDSP